MQQLTSLRRSEDPQLLRGVAFAALIGFAVGTFTAFAQGFLPDSVRSFANSAGPWSVVAFFVARRSSSAVHGAGLAAATLAMCEIGYVVTNEIRGVPSATSTVMFWLAAAALAGPPLGVAAYWSASAVPLRRGAGFGVISGVLIGEGLWAWNTVADTTDWRYWMVEVVIGAAILIGVCIRYRSASTSASAAGVAATVAAVVAGAAAMIS